MARIALVDAKIEALKLYLAGVMVKDIAKRLGKTPQTIINWKKKYGWQEDKELLLKELEKRAQQDEIKRREQYLKLNDSFIAKYTKRFNEKAGERKMSHSDMLKSMEFNAKIRGYFAPIQVEGKVEDLRAYKMQQIHEKYYGKSGDMDKK